MTVLTPAVMEADPLLCPGGHREATVTDPVILHLQAAAPALVHVLTHAATELQIILVAVTADDLALTVPIPGAHPDMDDEDIHALSAALLQGAVITEGQGGPALALQARGGKGMLTLAGSNADSPPLRRGDTTGANQDLRNSLSGLVRKVNRMCS